jgi:hypothetical protein
MGLQVVGSTQPADSATSSNCNLTLVVQAEGVEATSIEQESGALTEEEFEGEKARILGRQPRSPLGRQ